MSHPTIDVPTWFVENCVKTSSQLKEQHIRLILRDPDIDAEKQLENASLSRTSSLSSFATAPEDDGTPSSDKSDTTPTPNGRDQLSLPESVSHKQAVNQTTEVFGTGDAHMNNSDPYELATSMYQSLQELVLPLEPETDVTESRHLSARTRLLGFATGLLLATITRFTIVRMLIDSVLFIIAVFIPANSIHYYLDYIGTPTPPFLKSSASLRPYQRFQFFKHTLLNLLSEPSAKTKPCLQFSHDGVVLRFARMGGGGHQFLISVVEYFARSNGADLVILSNDKLHELCSQWHREWTQMSTDTIAPQKSEFPGKFSCWECLQDFYYRVLTAGRYAKMSQRDLDEAVSSDPIIVLLDGMLDNPTPSHQYNPVPPHNYMRMPHNPPLPIHPRSQATILPPPTVMSTFKNTLSVAAQRRPVLVIAADQHNSGYFSKAPGQPLRPSPNTSSESMVLSRFVSNPANPIEIAPWQSRSQSKLLDQDDRYHAQKNTEAKNINKIKTSVASLLEKHPESLPLLFQPYTPWNLPVGSESWQILQNRILDSEVVHSIATQVVHKMTIEGINSAIRDSKERMDHRTGILDRWRAAVDDSDDEIAGFPRRVRKVINKIKEGSGDEFKLEAEILSSLVNPAHLQDTWDDIALEPDVKQHLLRLVSFNVEKPEAYGILKEAQIGGALLYGPPGTGKTHLARVLAKQANATMIQISPASIENMWVGETEKLIKALFNLARMVAPCIIFIDEAEALFHTRTSDDPSWVTSRINQLLSESDGLLKDEKSRPFLILASNHPNQLDHAVLRRIPGRIYLGLPSLEVREALFRIYLQNESIEGSVCLPDLARRTEKYSGSDLRSVCVHAATIAQSELQPLQSGTSCGKRILTMTYFQKALKLSSPTIGQQAMNEVERFAAQFDHQGLERIRANLYPKTTINRQANLITSRAILDYTSDHAVYEDELEDPKTNDDREADSSKPPGTDTTNDDTAKIQLGSCTSNSPYQSLDRTLPEIRVLELIEPSTSAGPIQCRLRTVTLQHGLAFTALSYMWGNPALNEEILLNEQPFRITKRLANALRWVKHHWQQYFPERNGSGFLLWADAICINQADNNEKELQVPLMGKIFQIAELVIASIASGDVAIGLALKTYHNIYNTLAGSSATYLSLQELTKQDWMSSIPYLSQDDSGTQLSCCEEEVEGDERYTLSSLMSRVPNMKETDFIHYCNQQGHIPARIALLKLVFLPYWNRVWVIQEVVLGKNVLLMCDDISLNMDILGESLAILQLSRSVPGNRDSNDTPDKIPFPKGWCEKCWVAVTNFNVPIFRFRRKLTPKNVSHTCSHCMAVELFSDLYLLEATNPKDLVYGLLGLSKIDIEVNYSGTLGETYGDYVRYWIERPLQQSTPEGAKHGEKPVSLKQHYHFLLLNGIDAWRDQENVPSWVPNFQSSRRSILKVKRSKIRRPHILSPSDAFGQVRYPELVLAGTRVQRIQIGTRIITGLPKVHSNGYTVDKGFLNHLRDLMLRGKPYKTGIPMLQAVCRALDQNEDLSVDDMMERWIGVTQALMKGEEYGDHYRVFEPSFQRPFTNDKEALDWHARNLGFTPTDAWVKYFNHGFSWTSGLECITISDRFPDDVRKNCLLGSFFETEDGFLGLGPSSVTADDELCFFHHCIMPVILRRRGDHHVYVGPCWVVGLDSFLEILELRRMGKVEECRFVMQ